MAAGIDHRHAARGWGRTSTVACRSARRVCSCAFAFVIIVSRLACCLSGFGFLFGLLSGGVAFLLVRFAALLVLGRAGSGVGWECVLAPLWRCLPVHVWLR